MSLCYAMLLLNVNLRLRWWKGNVNLWGLLGAEATVHHRRGSPTGA